MQALTLLTIASKGQAAPTQEVCMPAVRLRSVQKYTAKHLGRVAGLELGGESANNTEHLNIFTFYLDKKVGFL